MKITVGTWNAEWATPSTKAGPRISEIIEQIKPDIFVLTEGCADLLPKSGYVIDGGTDWGYAPRDERNRKVLAWSKHPWRAVNQIGSYELPPGRFVSGTTKTDIGDIKVIGVCIPWQSAHTTTGHKNRKPWEDHEKYLAHLAPLITPESTPLIVAGDFNQRIPQSRQPQRIYEALTEAFRQLSVATIQNTEPPLIDHITHSQHLTSESLSIIPDTDQLGYLSDHRGAIVGFRLNEQTQRSKSWP